MWEVVSLAADANERFSGLTSGFVLPLSLFVFECRRSHT